MSTARPPGRSAFRQAGAPCAAGPPQPDGARTPAPQAAPRAPRTPRTPRAPRHARGTAPGHGAAGPRTATVRDVRNVRERGAREAGGG
ncbi:hypothetical protein GCM10010406_19550 [Streptomyces thermolineatus]|uniref:Uncharacterized protein n=1 Tax=Streptomyces thermolineatus TaxID=44033 RepID=A0ABN3LJT1_9ACTN